MRITFTMNKSKLSYGIVAITTIVLMFATTIGSALNQADARVDQRNDPVNQRANQASGIVQNGGLLNVGVGNVGLNVGIPANVCVICG